MSTVPVFRTPDMPDWSPLDRPETYRAHPAFIAREMSARTGGALVGASGCYGMRWTVGPLMVERYTGDAVPQLTEDGRQRLVLWQPLQPDGSRTAGWWPSPKSAGVGMTGYATRNPDDSPYARWSENTKRQAKKFARSGWVIRDVTVDEFLRHYERCIHQGTTVRQVNEAVIRSKLAAHGDRVRLVGAAPSVDARIEAAFMSCDVPETAESLHVCSYICPDALDVGAGSGLMDHWFHTRRERGIRFFDFGMFWRPGDPAAWKGLSRFKSQFGTRLAEYPRPMFRWYRGKGR